MAKVTYDYSKAAPFIREDEVKNMERPVTAATELLLSGEGAGSDFLGWTDLPVKYDKEEFDAYRKNFFPVDIQEKRFNELAFEKA